MFELERFYAGYTGSLTVGGRAYELSVVELGSLKVSSGLLGASDPFVSFDHPLVTEVRPGTHPVSVTVADVSGNLDGSHVREAYLTVHFAAGTIARLEPVTPVDASATDADPDLFYGVGVDAGAVALVDVDAIRRCMPADNWHDTVFFPDVTDGWFDRLEDPEAIREGSANIVLPHATNGENVILSASGWGDGVFPLVRTYDATDNLLGVHVDLRLFDREFGDEVLVGAPAATSGGIFNRLLRR